MTRREGVSRYLRSCQALHVAEQGSDQVLAVCQQADSLVVSVICLPELISTLSRLVRERKLASAALPES
jgi:hypothetical protein